MVFYWRRAFLLCLLLAGLRFGCGGPKGGETAPLGDLLLTLLLRLLHSLGQQLGVLCSLLLVLLCALSLQGNASALVLQYARRHQTLDLRGLGPGLLTLLGQGSPDHVLSDV